MTEFNDILFKSEEDLKNFKVSNRISDWLLSLIKQWKYPFHLVEARRYSDENRRIRLGYGFFKHRSKTHKLIDVYSFSNKSKDVLTKEFEGYEF